MDDVRYPIEHPAEVLDFAANVTKRRTGVRERAGIRNAARVSLGLGLRPDDDAVTAVACVHLDHFDSSCSAHAQRADPGRVARVEVKVATGATRSGSAPPRVSGRVVSIAIPFSVGATRRETALCAGPSAEGAGGVH